MKKAILLIVLLVVGLIGFGVFKLVHGFRVTGSNADAAVALFHERFNAARDSEIYDSSAPQFKAAGTSENWEKAQAARREQLGQYQTTERMSINLNNTNGNNTVVVDYRSTFDKGNQYEQFTFDNNGDQPVLLKYDAAKHKLNALEK
jgi:Tfp pilus assembly protein PilX